MLYFYKRNVLEMVSQCVGFIKACHIEFCMMLCKQLSDDDKNGVSFKCIKDCYNMLDIIELEKPSCESFEDEDLYNPSGYEELAQALRSVIWSNVDLNHGTKKNILFLCCKIKAHLLIFLKKCQQTGNLNLAMDQQTMKMIYQTMSLALKMNWKISRSF